MSGRSRIDRASPHTFFSPLFSSYWAVQTEARCGDASVGPLVFHQLRSARLLAPLTKQVADLRGSVRTTWEDNFEIGYLDANHRLAWMLSGHGIATGEYVPWLQHPWAVSLAIACLRVETSESRRQHTSLLLRTDKWTEFFPLPTCTRGTDSTFGTMSLAPPSLTTMLALRSAPISQPIFQRVRSAPSRSFSSTILR